MTEKTWRQQTRPMQILIFLATTASERKLLLFNCACCQRVWERLGEEDRNAVTRAERSADDSDAIRALQRQLEPERDTANAIARGGFAPPPVNNEIRALLESQTSLRLSLVGWEGGFRLAHAATELAAQHKRQKTRQLRKRTEENEQMKLIRDIFGNPFRPIAFSSEWRTDTVLTLARQMYESRDFSAMPILADALQDTGCDSEDILNHCRGPGPHVRGCWVVDLVLGK